jgi:hypothetical protein
MSGAAGERHDPPHTDVSGTNNSTGGKLANCKSAGEVGGYNLLLLLSHFGVRLNGTAG